MWKRFTALTALLGLAVAGGLSGSYEFSTGWVRDWESGSFFQGEASHKLNLNLRFAGGAGEGRAYLYVGPREALTLGDAELRFRSPEFSLRLFYNLKEGQAGDLLGVSQAEGWGSGTGFRLDLRPLEIHMARLGADTGFLGLYRDRWAGLDLLAFYTYKAYGDQMNHALALQAGGEAGGHRLQGEVAYGNAEGVGGWALEAQALGSGPLPGFRYTLGMRHVTPEYRAYLSQRWQSETRLFGEPWRENAQAELYGEVKSEDVQAHTVKVYGLTYAGNAGRVFGVGLEGWRNPYEGLRPYGKLEYAQSPGQSRLSGLLELAWYGKAQGTDLALKANTGFSLQGSLSYTLYGEAEARRGEWRFFGKALLRPTEGLATFYAQANLSLSRLTLSFGLGEADFEAFKSFRPVFRVSTAVSF
ncbi:hypothetical protein [Thermus caliditerrae]|uniref:hypothetical protein n=1 Tax=Thermus caliditerrae TaxID=1330700 RepID=UPI001267E80B|nr:hypothetical protein [Thermus caliditerrae]